MTISRRIRLDVLKRDNSRCRRCSSNQNLEVHHLLAISHGGSNIDTNLITLCKNCHRYVEKHYALSNITILDVLLRIICDKHLGPSINEQRKSNHRLVAVSNKIYENLRAIKGKSFGEMIKQLLDRYELSR